MGDPIEVELRGYELTLRLADAQKIEIDSVHATDRAAPSEERHKVVAHPGVGELDKAASYHERKAGAPIAAGAPLTFALAGNQNCGKTTLFNQLTGSNQHVGNFPGVTVDRKDGVIRNHKGSHRNGPAGHLFPVPLLQRGDCHAGFYPERAPVRHYQHCGCFQH